MKICVSAPDSKIANLAILKIAQFWLNRGCTVKWYEPLFDQDAEALYISKIFSFTKDPDYFPNCMVFKGGTGFDIESKLPDEIEKITDIRIAYETLYPDIDYSIIFTTRGCVRNCTFCCVPKKEGMIHEVEWTFLNPRGKYIKILDNNFFAHRSWRDRLELLNSWDQPLDFTQGIDIRTLTEEQCEALGKVKIKRSIHFAWDNLSDEAEVMRGIERLSKHIPYHKMSCYILVGYENREIMSGDHYRVKKLLEFGITPFAMGYIDFYNPKFKKTESVRHFCRFVNTHLCKIIEFKDYDTSIK